MDRTSAGRSKRRRLPRALAIGLFACYLVLLFELGSRAYWTVAHGTPFFEPARAIERYYPGLGLDELRRGLVRDDDEAFDVLLLGGSVVSNDFGDVAPRLERRLSKALYRPVRVWNLAQSGHTTRDSLLKYTMLGGNRFDLVLVYHGVNDARMNNCPLERFQNDYTHCKWYREVEFLRTRPICRLFAAPVTACRIVHEVWQNLPGSTLMPLHVPRERWTRCGQDVKTAATFRANVEEIVRIARERGEPVALGAFAFYLPADYSLEKFRAKELDYASHALPVEIWGSAANVAKAVEAHNDAVRRVCREQGVVLVDVASAAPQDREHFNDCCHLTEAGCDVLVETVVASLAAAPSDLRLGVRPDAGSPAK